MGNWNFNKNGEIDDGLGHSVEFNKLVKYQDDAVRDIEGNELPIAVADASKLGGKDAVQFATKDLVPITGKAINKTLSGTTYVNNLNEEIAHTTIIYKGQNNDPYLPLTGDELLPNTEFDDYNDVSIENDANLSVADNVLRVNAENTDYPAGYMSMDLEAETYYFVKITMGGTTPTLDITDPDGNVMIAKEDITGDIIRVFKSTIAGTYKFRMTMNGTGDDDTATFTAPTVKKINTLAFRHGNYMTSTENGVPVTELVTEIPSRDINYSPDTVYSNLSKENLAFFFHDFSLLQYVGNESGKDGYIKNDDGTTKEYLLDNDGNYIGDFDVDADLDNYNIVGNTAKAIENGAMKITRSDDGGNLEIYHDIETGVGKLFMFEFKLIDIADNWRVYLGSKNISLRLTGDDTTDKNKTVRFIYKSTDAVTRLKFICWTNADTNLLLVDDLKMIELDTSIWNDVTPITLGSSTAEFEWDSSDISFQHSTNGLGATNNHIHNTLLGGNISIFPNRVITIVKQDLTVKEFTNRGFKLGSHVDTNNKDTEFVTLQTSYNRIKMIKNSTGGLILLATDTVTGVSTGLMQTTDKFMDEVHHGLKDTPYVISINGLYDNGEKFDFGWVDSNLSKGWRNWSTRISSSDNIGNGGGNGSFNNHYVELNTYRDTITFFRCEAPSPYRKAGTYFGSTKEVTLDLGFIPSVIQFHNYISSNWVMFNRAKGFNTYFLPSLSTDNGIFQTGEINYANGKLFLTNPGPGNNVNDSDGSEHLYMVIAENDEETHSLKVHRPRLNTHLVSEDFKTITTTEVNEYGVINKLETLPHTVLDNLTKDDLK